MDTWTPLFSRIVTSSVWGEKHHVRIVWVTMLAMKDRDGFVGGTVPGLARMAVVTMAECREALQVLGEPDEESNNKEHEGRRISAVDGGWMVLGHVRFQALMRDVSTKIRNARSQKAWRSRQPSTPLKGELEYVKASNNGAGDRQLDRIASKHLPSE